MKKIALLLVLLSFLTVGSVSFSMDLYEAQDTFNPAISVGLNYEYEFQKSLKSSNKKEFDEAAFHLIEAKATFNADHTVKIKAKVGKKYEGKEYLKAFGLGYEYFHGGIVDVETTSKSKIFYERENKLDSVSYENEVVFADTLFDNDYVDKARFSLTPKYKYSWDKKHNSHLVSLKLGSEIDFINDVGVKFGMKPEYQFSTNKINTEKKDYKLLVDFSAELLKKFGIYSEDHNDVSFVLSGGLDSYKYGKTYVSGEDGKYSKDKELSTYILFIEPKIKYEHGEKNDSDFSINVGVRFKSSENSYKVWSYSPKVSVSLETAF